MFNVHPEVLLKFGGRCAGGLSYDAEECSPQSNSCCQNSKIWEGLSVSQIVQLADSVSKCCLFGGFPRFPGVLSGQKRGFCPKGIDRSFVVSSVWCPVTSVVILAIGSHIVQFRFGEGFARYFSDKLRGPL